MGQKQLKDVLENEFVGDEEGLQEEKEEEEERKQVYEEGENLEVLET